MKAYLFLFLTVFISFGGYSQQANPRYPKATEQQIARVEHHLNGLVKEEGKPDFTLSERMAYYHVNSVSIAVIRNFKLDWARAYGWANKIKKNPATVNTVFQAGSVSKTVNAMALMQMVQEGRLLLDGDINPQLKSWQFPYDSVSRSVKITLRHLLSHRAGLNVSGFAGYSHSDTIPDIYHILNGRPPAKSSLVQSRLVPGSTFRYSGGGTMISQLMAMDVDGKTYDELMQRRLFNPLEMKNSAYKEGRLSSPKATGYYWDGREIPDQHRIYPESAAAGLWTTPTDLAKLLIAYQKSYAGLSKKLLSTHTAREMAKPDSRSGDERHKAVLGFFVEQRGNRTYLTHDGKVEGFLSLFFIDPENGNGLVVMNNGDDALGLNTEIANGIAKVYGWKDFNVQEERKIITMKPEQLSVFTGTYVNGKDTLTIGRQQQELCFSSSFSYYGRPQLISFLSTDQFYVYEEECFTAYRGYKNQYFAQRNGEGHITAIIKRVKGQPEQIFIKK